MTMFAKLFETEHGQVLVKRDEADDGPEIRFYINPPGLGVCSIAHVFPDSDGGQTAADKAFDAVSDQVALAALAPVLDLAKRFVP